MLPVSERSLCETQSSWCSCGEVPSQNLQLKPPVDERQVLVVPADVGADEGAIRHHGQTLGAGLLQRRTRERTAHAVALQRLRHLGVQVGDRVLALPAVGE